MTLFTQTINFSTSAAKTQNKSFREHSNLKYVIKFIDLHFLMFVRTLPRVNHPLHFLRKKVKTQINYLLFIKNKTKTSLELVPHEKNVHN